MGCSIAGNYVNVFAALMIAPIVIIGVMVVTMYCGKMHPLRVRRNTIYLLFLAYPACGRLVGLRTHRRKE